ncbi:MAG: strictosidine synthase [Pseudomonadota bacterium]
MDGALKPNNLLDEARSLAVVPAPDNLVAVGGRFLFSSGAKLLEVGGGRWDQPSVLAEFDRSILAVAASPDGTIAVALDGAGIQIVGGRHYGKTVVEAGGCRLSCVTGLAFSGNDTVILCNGSSSNKADDWKRDLLEMKHAGTALSLDLATGNATVLADHLGFPHGILISPDGSQALVSESWNSRIIRVGLKGSGKPETVLDDLPGYPARLCHRSGGGAWLCIFAPRSQLIEFVLREKTYRHAMMAEVDPEFWIAPALFSGRSFSEPMQGGALKQMGILKPWAPTRSYGLVIELNEDFEPIASRHCRAGGRRHGIISCAEIDGELVLTSRGGDEVIATPLNDHGE